MYVFTRRFFIACFGLLLSGCLVLYAPCFAQCNSSPHYHMRAQVTNSAGGTCQSGNHHLTFSMGQPLAAGASQETGQNLSSGFITNTSRLAEADDTGTDDTDADDTRGDDTEADDAGADDTSAKGKSSNGSTCFIDALIKN